MNHLLMNKLSYAQLGVILEMSFAEHKLQPDTRLGQCIFNNAAAYFPDIVDSLRGSVNDCFYNDNKIHDFIMQILKTEP